MLLQQGNWQCGDGQHMECEVMTDTGQSVQCEVLTDSVQTAQCEVMTDSGRTVEDSSGHSDTEQRDGAVKSQKSQSSINRFSRHSETQWANVIYGDQITD